MSAQIELTEEQQQIVNQIYDWYRNSSVKNGRADFITLGGYAGTGKTTLIKYLLSLIENKASCVAYTGKAASVLTSKLDGITATTIHKLIYSFQFERIDGKVRPKFVRKSIEEIRNAAQGLIIVDEASMVNKYIWEDLLSVGVPILAVGDHGQLPPVGGNFNLMHRPQLKLEQIHRQAENSKIIQLSALARETTRINYADYKPDVSFIQGEDAFYSFLSHRKTIEAVRDGRAIVLCWRNTTRKKVNLFVREKLGYTSQMPLVGEKVIGLRNNYRSNITNGVVYEVKEIATEPIIKSIDLYTPKGNKRRNQHIERVSAMKLSDNGNEYTAMAFEEQFGMHRTVQPQLFQLNDIDLIDYAYCLTVHKAQGSQANVAIVVIEKGMHFALDADTIKRWLYTAVTRAEKHLVVVKL